MPHSTNAFLHDKIAISNWKLKAELDLPKMVRELRN